MEEPGEHASNLKRSTDSGGDPPRKLPKTAQPSDEDFSTSVRKKLSASSRTGQACDRCKIRKIKCDGNPDGCSPCQQAQHVCKTTDRNNGRTTVRGHTDRLEWELRYLREKVVEYQQQLRDLGVPVEDQSLSTQYSHSAHNSVSRGMPQSWQNHQGSDPSQSYPPLDSPHTYHAPAVDPAAGSASNGLSILNGTTLSLFGMEIDVVKFTNAHDDPNAPTAYETFVRYAFGQAAIPPPALPPTFEEAKKFAVWYFRSLNPYSPVLDKADFFALLTKRYHVSDSQPVLTAAEDVMIHMLFAELKFQHGSRNNYPPQLDQAYSHYQYSLTRFNELLRNRTVQDIQAMLLIAFKLRNFPKPGAAWMCAQFVITVILETNLHRSANALPEQVRQSLTSHQVEMRKRVFWTAYALIVGLSGKLGLPIPVRLEDVDIEIPEPVPDNLPEEGNLTEERQCSFHIGIAAMKMIAIQGQMYTLILGIRRSARNYLSEVDRIENELEKWKSSLPLELTDPTRASREWKVYSLYVQFWELECRFLLRHPVIHSATNPELYARNSKISLQVSSELLSVVHQLHNLKCLDIPWINVTVFLACIFTTLFIYDQKQDDITHDELQKLEVDMTVWLEIFKDVGRMLGTGLQLADSTRNVVDKILQTITRRIAAKTAAAVAAQALRQSSQTEDQGPSGNTGYSTSEYGPASDPNVVTRSMKPEERAGEFARPDQAAVAGGQQQYPQSRQNSAYTYPEPDVNSSQIYQSNPRAYAQAIFAAPASEQTPTQHVAQVAAQPGDAVQGSNSIYNMGNGATALYYSQTFANPAAEWVRWGQVNLPPSSITADGPQEFVNSANALVALGGRSVSAQDVPQAPAPMTEEASNWPLNIFSTGQPNGAAGT